MGNIYQLTTTYTKLPLIIPNGHKIFTTIIKYNNNFQCPPKCTPIGIFGFKINHRATLFVGGNTSLMFYFWTMCREHSFASIKFNFKSVLDGFWQGCQMVYFQTKKSQFW
jgi:hypothetical protein